MTKKNKQDEKTSFLNREVKIKVSSLLALAILLAALIPLRNLAQINKEKEIKKTFLPRAIRKVINNEKTKFDIKSLKRTSGLYQFELELNGQKYTSYLSADKKLLFTSGIKIADLFGLNKKLKGRKSPPKKQPATKKKPTVKGGKKK